MRTFYHHACARLWKAESSIVRRWQCQRCVFPEQVTLSHNRQRHLLCISICRTSRKPDLTPPGAWTTHPEANFTVSPFLSHSNPNAEVFPNARYESLADAFDRTLSSVSNTDCNSLVFFHYLALGILISANTAESSFSSVIRANLRRLTRSAYDVDIHF